MSLIFGKRPPAPPIGAPKKTPLKYAGEIRKVIVTGSHLFAIKQLPIGYDFDYRVNTDDYGDLHVTCLIKGNNFKVGSLTPNDDGYMEFAGYDDPHIDVLGADAALHGFAMSQFQSVFNALEVGCQAPTGYEFSIYE